MERSRVTKYVRIAVTALSLTACVLLVVMWVRSYWCRDSWTRAGSQFELSIASFGGEVWINRALRGPVFLIYEPPKPGEWQFGIPHRWLVLITGIVGAAPSMPWPRRFSLRTLLIATTLVAMALGMNVWAAK